MDVTKIHTEGNHVCLDELSITNFGVVQLLYSLSLMRAKQFQTRLG